MADFVDSLINLLINQSADEVSRRDAIMKLKSHNEPRVLEALKSVFDDRKVSVRYFAKKTYNDLLSENKENKSGKTFKPKEDVFPKNLPPSEIVKKIKDSIDKATSRKEFASRVIKLGETKDPSAVPVLIDFLGSELPRVRANAVEALEMIKGDTFIDEVVTLKNDEDNRTRANVAKFLWNKGKHELALEILENMIKSDFVWMKDSAIYVLRLIEDKRSIPILEIALKDHDESIRIKALKYINELETKFENMDKFNKNKNLSSSINKSFKSTNSPAESNSIVGKLKSMFKKRR